MIRQAAGIDGDDASAEDEAMTNFVAATDMGKIYYRTALAAKALDEMSQARKLLKVAQIYMPWDPMIQKEVAACALRLG